ncbi:probable 39S ribosomal protein L24, mitochondrial [Anopheles funestus]|uniref:Large ribosomal subunit protein uL24m n=1 Tax=Anopheles funestus TaxID=62324 RepID=A0A182RDT3_ANOFN|nr:probable 39S ribosomal protein L24, mitochondrial [Anopheles funestus]
MRLTALLQKVGDVSNKFSNFPDSYVKRAMEQVYWKTPRGKPQYLPRTVERRKFRFTTNRPWTGQFRQQNMPGTIRKKVFVEPIANWSFFRGDRVEVLVGKDKGKQGIVSQVIQERNWVIVSGLNCHLRKVADEKEYPGIMIKSESPLLVTNQVQLVDPSDLQATAIEWRYTEDGEKVRVSTRSGRIIPIPKTNEETNDYKSKSTYIEREKDTPADVVKEISFQPALCTFEMDIMQQQGIEETRVPHKTYWY